ncbi:LacI family DNA-binding transcriptional regulator [Streptomyces sp. NPDC006645]|uniref:LacI family DNA-binding transcriptional regulator n=1 Tax=unclassified Streptomyces TaxID=2593676 RepID=UPI0033B325DA
MTIRDVGAAAGVSTSTVSRVLNGTAKVDASLARRVQDAVADLGYRPNAAAQGLAKGEAGAIGVLVPDLANPYFPDVLKAVSRAARGYGRRVMIMESDEDAASEYDLALDLMRSCDGVLLCSTRMDRASLAELALHSRPMVLVNRMAPGLSTPSVSVDFYGGMALVCGHLTQLGHRRALYLSGPETSWANAERIRAFDAAAAFGLEVTIVPCGTTSRHGHQAVSALADSALADSVPADSAPVDSAPAGPAAIGPGSGATAIVAYNDLVALGAMAALEERGITVPTGMSVIGCDDLALDSQLSPGRLTTVSGARNQLGKTAVDTLELLMTAEFDGEPGLIPMNLIVRDTSAPPRPSAAVSS